MAYSQSASRRLLPVTAVALVHVAIGYAFVSGLAMKVIPWSPTPIKAILIPDEPPPPPFPPEAKPDPAPRAPTTQPRIVDVGEVKIVDLRPLPPMPEIELMPPTPPLIPEAQPPARDLSQAAAPRGQRAGWITTDDYPAAAIRGEEEGAVGIMVRIGGDGRVTECSVTRSSGHSALDEATCRLYPKRAQFKPARDADGNPTATSYNDRVVWKLP